MAPPFLLRFTALNSTLSRASKSSYTTPAFRASSPALSAKRHFRQGTRCSFAQKNDQDKDSINTDHTEYSKSGTDNETAEQEEAAFSPKETRPEEELKTAGKGKGGEEAEGNPLDVSPANQEVSKPRGEQEGGAERAKGGKNQSGEKGSYTGKPKKGKEI